MSHNGVRIINLTEKPFNLIDGETGSKFTLFPDKKLKKVFCAYDRDERMKISISKTQIVVSDCFISIGTDKADLPPLTIGVLYVVTQHVFLLLGSERQDFYVLDYPVWENQRLIGYKGLSRQIFSK